MRIVIAAAGRLRTGPEADLVNTYLTRARALARPLGFQDVAVAEIEASRGASGPKRQDEEAERLLAAAGPAFLIALDERGDDLSSEAFAALLGACRDQGRQRLAFLIGGADGHGPAVRSAVDRTIAFGGATWPHLLVRAMLCEQIYRAMTILSGRPYHRA